VVGLPDDEAVQPERPVRAGWTEVLVGLLAAARTRTAPRAIDDHLAAVHPAEVQVRGRDQHACRRVRGVLRSTAGARLVVAWPDQDPVARLRRVDRRLDR